MGLDDLGIGDAIGAVQPPIPVVQPQVQVPQPQVAPAVPQPAAKPLFNYGAQAPQAAVAPQGQVNLGQTAIDRQPLADGPQVAASDQQLDASARAIKGIESGGGNYSIVGPTSKHGDKPYGAYQVMGANVGPWTEKHFGQRLTPQQFLQNKEAQDAVFKGEFGGYIDKYGSPEEAARAWIGGPGGRHSQAKDVLGTSPDKYASKFNAGMSGAHLADAGNRTKTGTQGMTEIKGQMSPAQSAAMATDPQRAAVAQALGQPLPAVPHAPHLPSYDEWKQQHNQGALDGLRPLLMVGIAGALIVGAALGRKHGGGTQMALSGLAGFVNGMAAGSHSQASKGLAEYHAAVQNLKENYELQRSEYTDILQNRELNIDAKVSALKLKAAEYGDEKLAKAIEGGNIAAIDQVMKVRKQAMQHADDLGQAAVDRHKKFEYSDEQKEARAAEKAEASAEKEYDKSMAAVGKAEKKYKANPEDDSAKEAFVLAMQRAQMAREKQKEVLGRLSGKGPVSVGPEQGPKQDRRTGWQKTMPGFLGGKDDPNKVEGQVDPGAQQQEAAPAAAPPKIPTPGDTIDGYMFKGGDPASPDSWARHGA